MRAIVLSAGYGTRLGGLTAETPKPLLDAGGHSILELVLANLSRYGITEIAVNLHYRPELIRERLGDGSQLGVELHYVDEPELLGTAGSVANAAEFLAQHGTFLVQYGDVVTDHDVGELVARHRQLGGIATILVHERRGSNSAVEFDDRGLVSTFLERPPQDVLASASSPWVFSGLVVCEPKLVDLIPGDPPSDLPRDVFGSLVERRALFAVPLRGYRCAVDSPERLEELRAAVSSGRLVSS